MASKLDRMIESHPIPGIVVGVLLVLVGWVMFNHLAGLLPLIFSCGVMGAGIGAAGGGIRALVKAKKKDG